VLILLSVCIGDRFGLRVEKKGKEYNREKKRKIIGIEKKKRKGKRKAKEKERKRKKQRK